MTNRLRVYYPYRCDLCHKTQYRGSAACRCNLGWCKGKIRRVRGGKAQSRPLRIMEAGQQ